jgi:hypothetical protein
MTSEGKAREEGDSSGRNAAGGGSGGGVVEMKEGRGELGVGNVWAEG